MKTLIADKFSEAHLDCLSQLGCEVTYKPTAKAEELPGLISPYKILVVRSKQVTADTFEAGGELALVLMLMAACAVMRKAADMFVERGLADADAGRSRDQADVAVQIITVFEGHRLLDPRIAEN